MDPKTLPLRDIHLPEPVSWWPPAPGWWLLLLSIALIIGGLWWWRRRDRHRRLDLRQAALSYLRALRQGYDRDGDAPALAAGLSALLRRISLQVYPRTEVAGLTGEAWLAFLDRVLGDHRFTRGPGRVLEEAPYRRQPQIDAQALLALSEAWIQALPDPRRTESRG